MEKFPVDIRNKIIRRTAGYEAEQTGRHRVETTGWTARGSNGSRITTVLSNVHTYTYSGAHSTSYSTVNRVVLGPKAARE